MGTVIRFVLGFVVGCVLFAWSFVLAGVGHGSIVPLASAAPFLFVSRHLFNAQGLWGLLLLLIEMQSTGLLWAIYFCVFPAINSFVIRILLVVLVVVVHVGTAASQLSKDFLLADSFNQFPAQTGGYFVLFAITLLSLGVLASVGSKRRNE